MNFQGFLKADAAPITTAKTRPIPAPREAPTAAAVIEDDLAFALASIAITRSRSNSANSLSVASSLKFAMQKVQNCQQRHQTNKPVNKRHTRFQTQQILNIENVDE